MCFPPARLIYGQGRNASRGGFAAGQLGVAQELIELLLLLTLGDGRGASFGGAVVGRRGGDRGIRACRLLCPPGLLVAKAGLRLHFQAWAYSRCNAVEIWFGPGEQRAAAGKSASHQGAKSNEAAHRPLLAQAEHQPPAGCSANLGSCPVGSNSGIASSRMVADRRPLVPIVRPMNAMTPPPPLPPKPAGTRVAWHDGSAIFSAKDSCTMTTARTTDPFHARDTFDTGTVQPGFIGSRSWKIRAGQDLGAALLDPYLLEARACATAMATR